MHEGAPAYRTPLSLSVSRCTMVQEPAPIHWGVRRTAPGFILNSISPTRKREKGTSGASPDVAMTLRCLQAV